MHTCQTMRISVFNEGFLLALTTLCFAVLAIPSKADGARPIDYERHRSCLNSNTSDPTACFHYVSLECQVEEIERAANALRARMWCDLREYEVWKSATEAAMEVLKLDLPAEEFAALSEQQEKWNDAHSVSCKFPYEFLHGTWVSSGAAHCLLEDYQARAARVLGYLRHLEFGEFAFQSRD